MRKKIHKWFWSWEHEKEEQWLNTMANQGWGLVSVGLATYEFEECEPGEYCYRIQLLENARRSIEGQNYISFIEETGAQQVGCYINWVYFRKKASDGPFDLFSDYESRIKHYKLISRMMLPLGVLNIWTGLQNLAYLFVTTESFHTVGIINLFVGALLLFGCYKVKQKIDELKEENQIFE